MSVQTKGQGATPMMQQYYEMRGKLSGDTLLLFRLGDFYEMFDNDAYVGAAILGITLTRRHDIPMAGIPYHAADNYVGKLLKAGKKVAMCEQMEAPKPGKLVKRAITRILTAGTVLEGSELEACKNNYLLALDYGKKGLQAAWLDLSTGTFEIASEDCPQALLPVLSALDAREIILIEGSLELWRSEPVYASWLASFLSMKGDRPISEVPRFNFDFENGYKVVTETLGVLNLDGFGIARGVPAIGAAGAVLLYVQETLCQKPENIVRIRQYDSREALLLDPATLRNLEIFQSAGAVREGSLIAAMDRTVTAAGARQLERYLAEPLLDLDELERRQSLVGSFIKAFTHAEAVQTELKSVRDITRILSRLQNRLRSPREVGAIRDTLDKLPAIREALMHMKDPNVDALLGSIHIFEDLCHLLNSALEEELPANLLESGYMASGYDAELDRLRSLTRENQNWITDLERAEQAKTGIKNLKIKYNGSFGYFIEVTKANTHLVPETYIRKQTMTNAERYYTDALKEKEREILHADERALEREQVLFRDLVSAVLKEADDLRETAQALAEVDIFIGWAQLARDWDYCKPKLDNSEVLSIEQGRHPVVEQMLHQDPIHDNASFVPNDTQLSCDENQIALITGPNMAGKSTYIRQVALIVLMAQVGSWVPAASCHVGLVDRIFSRIGASDELARGNSTFMVEMNETANILNNATDRSLIILDEIGRGTSTYDGLSIAWAVLEHLHGEGSHGPRTLFATHYHELTQLEEPLARLQNYCVLVKEWNDTVIFVRQVVPGSADRSYGIQVARLAGLPDSVIARANTILSELESQGQAIDPVLMRRERSSSQRPKNRLAQANPSPPQLQLFS